MSTICEVKGLQVNSSHGELVTRWTRHKSELVTRWSRHTV